MCKEMLANIENKWSKQKHCLSKANVSVYICIDKKNLQTAIRNLSYTYLFTSRYANKSVRHAAYCQSVMGNHGHVGARHQVVIPLCWVCAIRGKKHQFQLKYLKSTTSPGLKRYF